MLNHPLSSGDLPITITPQDFVSKWKRAGGLSETEHKKRTLTNLYNQHPTWLELAHLKLDQAVFVAYGWPNDLTDDQILEKLLALNLGRASLQSTK